MVCANRNGSEKFPVLFFRNAKKPRCFSNNTGGELGFYYEANKKARMKMAIFFNWLQCFDFYISRTSGCTFLLTLDNFSGHGSASFLASLSSVWVEFLPADTTFRLRPMDAGTTAGLKRRYRTMQYSLALNVIDLQKNICKTDQLTAMR